MTTTRIRAVVFDAVGTLIEPRPPAADVYALLGARFGSSITADQARRRFPTAFDRQERLDAEQCAGKTSEARERQRWRSIVAEVLPDAHSPDVLFDSLWDHFARPDSWRVLEGAPRLLAQISGAGLAVAVASNFDSRLRCVWEGHAELPRGVELFISSELGRRKPHPEFFAHVEGRLGLPAESILLVGDDPVNDVAGAEAAGWQAALVGDDGLAAAVRSALPLLGADAED